MATRKFEIETPLELLMRWAARADQLKSTLFVGGVRFTFDDNVKVESALVPREGEWVGRDAATGKWQKAISTKASCFPVFLDPGAPRTDMEGGLAVMRCGSAGVAPMTFRTNMIGFADSVINLRPGSELIVGALPAGHDFEGENGLIPLSEDAGPTSRYVVAVVEESLGSGMYRCSTVSYWASEAAVTSVP